MRGFLQSSSAGYVSLLPATSLLIGRAIAMTGGGFARPSAMKGLRWTIAMARPSMMCLEVDAVRTAEGSIAGRRTVEAELEQEDGRPVYEIEMLDSTQKKRKVYIDAATGKVSKMD